MTETTITRRKLVDLALELLEDYKDDVSREDRNHLLYAACTMEYVAAGNWVIDEECGCLVGTMMLNQAKDQAKDPVLLIDWDPGDEPDYERFMSLQALGEQFDEKLIQYLDDKYDFGEVKVRVLD